jgi:hypothetical protein
MYSMPVQVVVREPQGGAESSAREMGWREERRLKQVTSQDSSFDIGH